MYKVGFICEGKTDQIIIQAVLDTFLEDYRSFFIQPPKSNLGGDSGLFGGGWKGVQKWCEQETKTNKLADLLSRIDLLIIQVDADVAIEANITTESFIHSAELCLAPKYVNHVRILIQKWLGLETLPEKIILCVPSMASETWAFVALCSDDKINVPCISECRSKKCIECQTDIKRKLKTQNKKIGVKLVTSKKGKLRNHASAYFHVQEQISKNWDIVTTSCCQADRFNYELESLFSILDNKKFIREK